MDRFVPRRCRMAILLVVSLGLGVVPAPDVLARLPVISEEPAGDPGDGVLRPADQNPSSTAAVAQGEPATSERVMPVVSGSAPYLLVPVPVVSGSPWPVVFRLVRVERVALAGSWQLSFGGRWHRAP